MGKGISYWDKFWPGIFNPTVCCTFCHRPIFEHFVCKFGTKNKGSEMFKQNWIVNSIIVLGVTLAVAFSYYYRYDVIMSIVGRFNNAGEAGGGSVFSPASVFYLNAIFWQIGLIG